MPAASLLQIVPGFKPDVNGLGDFARILGDVLWKKKSIQSHFAVYDRPKKSFDPQQISPNTISYAAEATPQALLAHIRDLCTRQKFDHVLIQYGSYAYSSKGMPLAFARAVEELASTLRVSIFFHEVWATAMPWKRAFWTYPEQRKAALILARNAQVIFTSNSEYIRSLQRLNVPGAVIRKAPVISNVGEPDDPLPLSSRARQLVIFGQFSNRRVLYEQHLDALRDICKLLRIETIVDVGSGQSSIILSVVDAVEVKRAGWMDEQQVSTLLSGSIAGLVCYTPDIWEKSGVIAAYQAHALVPILVPLQKRVTPEPAYLPYVSVASLAQLAAQDGVVPDSELQSIADASHAYYVVNQSVNHCADVISDSMFQS
jgi:hypothetical protein